MTICSWNSVASSVISIIRDQLADHPDYSIATTGHSLGGDFTLVFLYTCLDRIFRGTVEPCGDHSETKLS
jgi:hypothetical protein